MDPLSDHALMLQVSEGKTETLGLLYERYKRRLFGFFYQLGCDRQQSEDLVQETFMRVLRYRKTYTNDKSFMAWLFHIGRNVFNTHYSKQNRQGHPIELTDYGMELGEAELETIMDKLHNIRQLEKALNRLTLENKELILLNKFKEMRYKEIAEVVGCTEGAARTRTHRALQQLKTVFFELEKSER